MGFRTFACMDIAVIGSCKTSVAIGEKLALAGHRVFFGLKNNEADNIELSDYIGNIYFETITNAASAADVIILSSPAEDIREIAYLLDDVRGKVIIDVSGNIDPHPEEYVFTVRATRSITGAADVVKAFSGTGLQGLLSPIFEEERHDMFVAGDSKRAKAMTMLLARDMGFINCYDFGNQDTIPMLEDMARCWHNLAIRQKMGEKIAFKIVKR